MTTAPMVFYGTTRQEHNTTLQDFHPLPPRSSPGNLSVLPESRVTQTPAQEDPYKTAPIFYGTTRQEHNTTRQDFHPLPPRSSPGLQNPPTECSSGEDLACRQKRMRSAHFVPSSTLDAFVRVQPKGRKDRRVLTSHDETWRSVIIGMVLATMIMSLPMLNAFMMLWDMNYVFWVGWVYPVQEICICFFGILFLGVTLYLLYVKTMAPYTRFQYAVATTVSCFLALFGILLVLSGMTEAAVLRQVQMRLTLSCGSADPTLTLLLEYSQVLQNMRSQPECSTRRSVEECDGWSENRYTNYVRYLEKNLDCGPICYPGESPLLFSALVQEENATLLADDRLLPHHHAQRKRSASVLQVEGGENAATRVAPWAGMPKLFDIGYTKMPCTPLVQTRMQAVSWCFGDIKFWQGYLMIFASIVASFMAFVDLWKHGVVSEDLDI